VFSLWLLAEGRYVTDCDNWGKVGKGSGGRDKGTTTTPTSNDHQQHQKPNEQTKSKSQNIWQEKTKSAAPPPKKIGFSNAVAVRIMG